MWRMWRTPVGQLVPAVAVHLLKYRTGMHTKPKDNTMVGDMVLLLTVTKFGMGKYKICRVVRTFPDTPVL